MTTAERESPASIETKDPASIAPMASVRPWPLTRPGGAPRAPTLVAPMVGTSAAIRRVHRLIEQAGGSDVPVLITGDVGVGKDVVAREVHRRSQRSDHKLLEVHCASIAQSFFDEGSPPRETSVLRNLEERLESADEGTLFLEEIDALSMPMQDKLHERLSRRPSFHSPDFRLIAATHRDLARAVEAGTFSEALFYRINVIHIHVPPLRERLEDVPALVAAFLQEHAQREGEPSELPAEVIERFMSYEWPGNVRELENAVLRFLALHDATYVLEELDAQAEHGTRLASTPPPRAPAPSDSQEMEAPFFIDLKELGRKASDSAEREAIVEMLQRTMGNKRETAKRLGISYKALLYKIHDFGIANSRSSSHRAAS